MSRRKQTKLLHEHNEREEQQQEQQDVQNGQLTAEGKMDTEDLPPPHTPTPTTATSEPPTADTPILSTTDTPTTDSVTTPQNTSTLPTTTHDLRGRKRKISNIEDVVSSDNKKMSFRDCSFQVNTSDIGPSPVKKISTPSYENAEELTDYSRSRSSIATALVLAAESSRRQSSRLQLAASPSRASGGEGNGKKTSHRTCEYCGVIKPTPAALQRHIRKHTGERPFVCQVCQKAYKAKRSLLCHQLTHHPELNEANLINGSDDSLATPPKRGRKPSTLRQITPPQPQLTPQSHTTHQSDVSDSPPNSDRTKSFADAELEESVLDGMEGKDNTSSLVIQNGCQSVAFRETTQDFSANVSTISADGMDMDGDETVLEASKRSCQYCHKEFVKPSDLKRHLMVHTGEKPYTCQFCKKGFKQPQSLNYHLKATHKVNIPLSQGLEERYLRLKTRAAMRNLAAMDTWTPKSGQDAIYTSELSSSSFADSRPQSRETEKENHHQLLSAIPQPQASCSSFSPDFKHGLARQTSMASEGSWTEDRALGPNMVEVELPQFPALDGSLSEEPGQKVPMAVKKESMLMTQLDGVYPITKQDMQVFRCCLCDKVCASMFHAFCHLSSHFEQTPAGLECRACKLAFTSQPEMDDHYQRQHNVCLSDLDLQNNNHKLKALKGEDRSRQAYNFSGKSAQGLDDHNNNNDDHINKEDGVACSGPTSPEPSSPQEGSVGFFEGLVASETFKYSGGGKGAYRCPKCSKCYMTKFLLDRHMAFHTRQDLIESAMKNGASMNGAHKDLLMQPPPVVPQNTHRYFQLQELDMALKAQQEENERLEHQDIYSGESAKQHIMNLLRGSGFEGPKEGLEKDGIEDVVVVMPTDPDDDTDNEDVAMETDIGSEVKDSEMSESEIGVSPKKQLIPRKSESSPSKPHKTSSSKSRRKSSLPTRHHRSAIQALDGSSESQVSPAASTYPSEEPQQPEPSASSSQETEDPSDAQKEDPSDGQNEDSSNAPNEGPSNAQSRSSSPKRDTAEDSVSESPSENEGISKEFPKEAAPEAGGQQQDASYLQNLHSAFNRMSSGLLANLYSSNGMFSPSSLASAAAGYLGPFPPVPGRSSFSLHAPPPPPASVCTPSSLPPAHSPLSSRSGHEDDQVEDVSVSSGSVASPAASQAVLSSGHADRVAGYPHMMWDTPGWSQAAADRPPSPSPLSPPSSSATTANGKRITPMWHTLSSEDLSNASVTDGRKVTSLSRTHSRLYVVNQPVDRERACKPTVLPDGRTVFRCVFCLKDFLSYSDINRHMDFHEDIRPYKCNFCDYFARTNSQLKVHMMRHQGIREYCCQLCKYKGVTQSDLNRHMKSQIHVLKSQNECSKCGEGFVTAKTLEKHMATSCKSSRVKKEKLSRTMEAV